MAAITLDRVSKSFGAVRALKEVDLSIGQGEFVAIVGPSGCGKTTLLRLASGLEVPDHGRILVDGRDVSAISPKERGFGFVFQDFALYSHLSVYRNIEHPLKVAGIPSQLRGELVARAAAMLEIERLLPRGIAGLSGGEAQRVGLGRALVKEPRALFMDEPLSNLDQWQARRLRQAIREECRKRRVTTLFVTHDQGDAFVLADRIVVMRDGRVEQVGSALDLLERPRTAFVALFIGDPALNLLPGWMERNGEHTVIQARGWSGRGDDAWVVNDLTAKGRTPVALGIRPYHVHLGVPRLNGDVARLSVEATVDARRFVPPVWIANLTSTIGALTVVGHEEPPASGHPVTAWFDLKNVVLLPSASLGGGVPS